MQLYYRNHKSDNDRWMNTASLLGVASDVESLVQDHYGVQNIAEHECILLHSPNMLEKFLNAAVNGDYDASELKHRFDDKCIIFFMSSEPLNYQPSRATYRIDESERTAYVFYIKKDGRAITREEWSSLFAWAKTFRKELQTNGSITDEQISLSMAPCVRELLCGTSGSHLIALSILCQGYLAAHGGKGLDGWDNSLADMLKKGAIEETNEPGWWAPAMGGDAGKTLRYQLEHIKDRENDKSTIKYFIGKLNEDNLANEDNVKNVYDALKALLGKGAAKPAP